MAEPAFRLPKINIPTASAKQIEDQTSNPAALFDIVGSLKTNPPITGKPVMITKAQYQAQAAQGYNRIPLVQELLADLDTPLSLYLKLANRPFSYLLESVVGGERFGRYSFIGLPCDTYLKVSGSTTEIYCNHQLAETHEGNPLHVIEQFHARFKTPEIPKLPRFTGGLVGYFGYESIYHFEHIAHRLKQPAPTTQRNTSHDDQTRIPIPSRAGL